MPGDTTLVPVKATSPIPRFMRTAVAPKTFQLSVEDFPEAILPGLASKESITGVPPVVAVPAQPTVIIKMTTSEPNDFFISHLLVEFNSPKAHRLGPKRNNLKHSLHEDETTSNRQLVWKRVVI